MMNNTQLLDVLADLIEGVGEAKITITGGTDEGWEVDFESGGELVFIDEHHEDMNHD